MKELAISLENTGSVPLIYGHRGLGKSSLALQINAIARGGVELLTQLDLEMWAPAVRFETFELTCTAAIRDSRQLLHAVVTAIETQRAMATEGSKSAERLVERSTRTGMAYKGLGYENTKRYETDADPVASLDLTAEEQLIQLCQSVTSATGKPILIVIDEFDQVGDTAGFASFLKSFSGPDLKFLLVGIASSQSELLRNTNPWNATYLLCTFHL